MMSSDLIPQLVEEMTTERAELVARQGLIDEALDPLRQLYPGTIPPRSADPVFRFHATALHKDGTEHEITPAAAAGTVAAPVPSLPINNRKPRTKTNGKAEKTPAPADAPPVSAAASLTAYDQATLAVLRANNGLTTTEVAEKMELTYASTWARLQRLKIAGLAAAGANKFWRAL
jgi:hypothetical protein